MPAVPESDTDAALIARIAVRCCAWSERWFPDAFAFAIVAVILVALGAVAIGASPADVSRSFGDGFWGLIPFTMQMCFIIIGGYVTADSPPVARLTRYLASVPRSGRGAVALVAVFGMLLALIHWGLSLMLASLLARTLAQRDDLRMDYRAAGAAATLGLGTVWALGLSSSAAQLQANPASMPPAMLAITGVIPFSQTIFLWQSMLLAVVIMAVGGWIAWKSAPPDHVALTARELRIEFDQRSLDLPHRTRPGDWLEYQPILNLAMVVLGTFWLADKLLAHGVVATIANLNTYNLLFLMAGLLLQWRPRRFMDAVVRSVPGVAGVLIQFPFLGAIAAIITTAKSASGATLSSVLSNAFAQVATTHTYALMIGLYSAVLGFFVPSGGGKWIIEAPYVMRAANELQYPLGWTVQIYNAAEALPNLINPFWMLPVLGLLGLKARDLIGFTCVQFVVLLPLVLSLLWLLGLTLPYHAPVVPPH